MYSEKDRLYKERVEWYYTLFLFHVRTYLYIYFQFLVHYMDVDIPIDVEVSFVPKIYVE